MFNAACITVLAYMTELGLTTETIAKWQRASASRAEEADAFGLKLAGRLGDHAGHRLRDRARPRPRSSAGMAATCQPVATAADGDDMSGRRLDGMRVAAAIRAELAPRVAAFAASQGRPPGLALVLAGVDPASEIYVRNKLRTAGRAPAAARDLVRLAETATLDDALAPWSASTRTTASTPSSCSRRCPRAWDADADQRVFDAIDPAKDVDGFHPTNVGLLVQKRPSAGGVHAARRASSCSTASSIPIAGRHAVVIGRSDIVGKPMALLLLHRDATVTICHSRTPDVAAVCRDRRRAGGRHRPARASSPPTSSSPGATVIDVGINRLTDAADVAAVLRRRPPAAASSSPRRAAC